VRARFAAAGGADEGVSDVARALALLAAEPRAHRVITHRLSLEEVGLAFATAAEPAAGASKVIVRPS
jgi:hypothetical protein